MATETMKLGIEVDVIGQQEAEESLDKLKKDITAYNKTITNLNKTIKTQKQLRESGASEGLISDKELKNLEKQLKVTRELRAEAQQNQRNMKARASQFASAKDLKKVGIGVVKGAKQIGRTMSAKGGITDIYQQIANGVSSTFNVKSGIIQSIRQKVLKEKPTPETIQPLAGHILSAENLKRSTKEIINGQERLVNLYEITDKTGTYAYKTIDGAIVKMDKTMDNTEKKHGKGKSGFIGKFFKIGEIRLIRRLWQLLESAIKKSFETISAMGNEQKKVLNSLSSSLQIFLGSIGNILYPIVKAIEPIINQLAVSFANIANEVSRAVAQMQGLAKYTKVNTKYMKEYGNASKSAFSFDTFTTLSGGDNNAGLFSQEAVGEDNQELSTTASIFLSIYDALEKAWQILSPIIKQIVDVLIPVIKEAVDMLFPILETISMLLDILMPILMPIIKSVTDALKAIMIDIEIIFDIINFNWDKVWINIKRNVSNGINKWIDMLNSVIRAFLAPINLITKIWGKSVDWQIPKFDKFASGGVAEAGTMFIAGEAGSEMVWNNSNGSSSILNVQQFTQAMVNAIYATNIPTLIENAGGDIYLDTDKVGTKLGQSRTLKQQLNRTNPNLNLR